MYTTESNVLKQRIDNFSKSPFIKTKLDFLVLKENLEKFLKISETNFYPNLGNYKAAYSEVLFQLITKFNLDEYNDEALACLKETIEAGQLNDLDVSSYTRMLSELQKNSSTNS